MRKLAILLLVAAPPLSFPAAAAAQSTVTGPDPVVTGDNRIICRRVTRTATRMRTGRICRTQSQWAAESGGRTVNPDDPNATIDGAADALEMAGEKVSTGDVGGFSSGHETPLGPR
ncbi:MAG TPA: hypothetical protein VGW40_13890 [Allosphingosinicella sp.]|nr:hypothetical protein [Allosphingosinicella sp.]